MRNNLKSKPPWLKRGIQSGSGYKTTFIAVSENRLHTICEEARCPNRGECWGRATATFMILGDVCTRRCGFCSVKTGNPGGTVDDREGERVADAVEQLNLKYIVLTSVDRDDLEDKGADHFRSVMEAVRGRIPEIGLEVLTPDFRGASENAIDVLLPMAPFVWAHNVETVPRLYPSIKRGARYDETLALLRNVKNSWVNRRRAGQLVGRVLTKSSIMLGLGERSDEVWSVLEDLRASKVDIVTLGQYMQPSPEQEPVKEYIEPEQFDSWKKIAEELGFKKVFSGPFVRSSYKAEEALFLFDQDR